MDSLIVLKTQGIYGLKPRFQNVLRPFARILDAAGIRANQVTVFTCAMSILLGLLLVNRVNARGLFLFVPIWLLIRMALNAVDGVLARDFDQKSNLGTYLNELGDAVSDVCCYLPFAYLTEFEPLWIGAVIVLAVISELAGVTGPLAGGSRRYDGPMGKSDRAFVFGALALWVGIGGHLVPWASNVIPRVLVILLAFTIFLRVRNGLAEIDDSFSEVVQVSTPEIRTAQESSFETHDNTSLFYRYWPPLDGSCDRAIILLHRGHEHSGRLQHVVEELDLPDFALFAPDARGHGRSVLSDGNSPTLGTFVKDVDAFVHHVSNTHGIPIENIAVVSHSVGSVLAATWAHDYAPKIRCMVLTAPAFKVKLYVPFARAALKLLHIMIGEFHVNSYVKPQVLTHDPERIASYKSDPLIKGPISVRVLLGLYDASDRIVADAAAIQVPTQLLISGSDWVVHRKPQLKFFERLGTSVKEKHLFDGFYHDVLGEKDRHLPIEKVRGFIVTMFAGPSQELQLFDDDKAGFTKLEFDALNQPLPAMSAKSLGFELTKLGLKTGGRLSDGIRLGLKTGFDSGSTLDYVYRNHASGITPIGKLIDWCYLHCTGWRGIRRRKRNVIKALLRSISVLRENGMPVRIVDIAAGHGRYVLEALDKDRVSVEEVLLRDYSEINVQLGSTLVRERKLEGTVRFERGDAFNEASLAEIPPRQTLGVVSGLYELFPENEPVRNSLAGLANAIEAGGFLVYTGQPFHPQLEMIARTLPSHRGHQPWIMRRRTQAEMDHLVEGAGFRKIEQWIDDKGLFTVSIAQRIGA